MNTVESPSGRGEVICGRISNNRALRKFVEKRIKQWLLLQQGKLPAQRDYRVVFDREGLGHQVTCWIEVLTQWKTWQGTEIGDGPEAALISGLERMHTVMEEAEA